jgi:hypothetical protein
MATVAVQMLIYTVVGYSVRRGKVRPAAAHY